MPALTRTTTNQVNSTKWRIEIWYIFILAVMAIFIIRLFYLQVIRHEYYQKLALQGQLKQYEIAPERGLIYAHDGVAALPIVLNETLYTIYADPAYIIDAPKTALSLSGILNQSANDLANQISTKNTRYVVLAKRVDKATKDKVFDLKLTGIGVQAIPYRTYPQGTLASQLLGFVNDDGDGKYGLEQALNDELKGQPGQLKAITDAEGVPLATNRENILRDPKPGQKILLTVDVGMQAQLEDILKKGLDDSRSASGSAIIMDINSGAIKAMANYPTYNPSEYYKVDNPEVFNNAAVSAPMEVGSIMKTLTVATALDSGAVQQDTSYYDPSSFVVDNQRVKNIEEDGGPGTRSIADILQLSLNTGATWLVMQMGGGTINETARKKLYDYDVNHYQLGKSTGIEQGYEAPGQIASPTDGFGLNIQYANMAFGQGLTITPLQMTAALASVLNGGTYYKPHLVEALIDEQGNKQVQAPVVVKQNVVSAKTSQSLIDLMEYVFKKNYTFYNIKPPRSDYSYGGKTGTAEIIKPGGGYYDDRFNGTFIGFVGGDRPQYVIFVRVNEPKIAGYAGSKAAAPIFGKLANMLIDNFNVPPKS